MSAFAGAVAERFYELSIYVKPALEKEFQYSELEHGQLQAVGFAAQLAGALLSSTLMDRIGRKPSVLSPPLRLRGILVERNPD